MRPSFSAVPFAMNRRKYFGEISLARSESQVPASAARNTRDEISVATIWCAQPSDAGRFAANVIAIVYGSSPLEQPALQMRVRLDRIDRARCWRQPGRIVDSISSNCFGSRKNRV